MKEPTKPRPDGRRPLLVYLDPKIIHALKVRALESNRHVYLLVEEALRADESRRAKATNDS
jgi:hypothetical protein